MADQKKDFFERRGKTLFWVAVAAVAAWALDQGKVVKKFIPASFNAVIELLKIDGDLSVVVFEKTVRWLKEHWRSFKISAFCWVVFALVVMTAGVYLHENGHPFGGQVVAVIGAVLLQMLFVLVMLTAAVFAKILMFKLGVIKQIASGRFAEEERKRHEEKHEKYKSHLTATFVLFSVMLVPFEIFVSWKALGYSVIMAGLALPAVFAVIHQKRDFGLVIETIKIVSISLVILTVVWFLCVELFPKSFGMLRFGKADSWFATITASEWIVSFIALGLMALLLYGVFAKDAQRRAASFLAFKWLVPISFGFILFLGWKGTIRYEDVTNHPSPSMPRVESLVSAIKKPFGRSASAAGLEDVHLAPPSEQASQSDVVQKRTTTVSKNPLPRSPQEKSYQDDLGGAIADLEALE